MKVSEMYELFKEWRKLGLSDEQIITKFDNLIKSKENENN
jgi:hypothetical protein